MTSEWKLCTASANHDSAGRIHFTGILKESRPVRVLIVGCGYLGERAARRWRDAGHTVAALTRSPDRRQDWRELGIDVIAGDVTDPSSLSVLPAADVCLFAVGYDRAAKPDKRTVYVNGLDNALQAIRGKIPRLIAISSTSVYGQDAGEIVNESSECHPTTEGGQICLDAENVIQQRLKEGWFHSAVSLRLAGIYGPGRFLARVDQLRAGVPFTGNPDAWLNLIHVDDAAEAVLKLSASPLTETPLLLTDGTPLRRRDFYTALAEIVGAPAPQFDQGSDQALNKRCDSSRTRGLLELVPQWPDARLALADAVRLNS